MDISRKDLIAFEKDICDNYGQGKIRAPVHLCGGNEDQLIEIFKRIKPDDWVFSTHRSHYHAILKSKDPNWVKEQIFLKRSSHINSREHRIFTSAIVGGVCPIALGVAMAIKKKYTERIIGSGKTFPEIDIPQVWCFVGDMASEMGIFHECLKYAQNHELPITYVIEDNGFGVYTPTAEAWGGLTRHDDARNLKEYKYERTYPHYGIGKWVTF